MGIFHAGFRKVFDQELTCLNVRTAVQETRRYRTVSRTDSTYGTVTKQTFENHKPAAQVPFFAHTFDIEPQNRDLIEHSC